MTPETEGTRYTIAGHSHKGHSNPSPPLSNHPSFLPDHSTPTPCCRIGPAANQDHPRLMLQLKTHHKKKIVDNKCDAGSQTECRVTNTMYREGNNIHTCRYASTTRKDPRTLESTSSLHHQQTAAALCTHQSRGTAPLFTPV